MRRLFLTAMLSVTTLTVAWAQRPFHSIRQLQEVSIDSLIVADGIANFSANSSQSRWKLQTSPHMGDTVTTVGIVVVPPGVITYTSDIWTMLLYDTTSGLSQWAGILLRGNLGDSTKLKQDGFLNVTPGTSSRSPAW